MLGDSRRVCWSMEEGKEHFPLLVLAQLGTVDCTKNVSANETGKSLLFENSCGIMSDIEKITERNVEK